MSSERKPTDEPELDRELDEESSDDAVIGRAFWISTAVIATIAAGGLLSFLLRADPAPAETVIDKQLSAPRKLEQRAPRRPHVAFTDITDAAGIDFVHVNGAEGGKYLPETMGGGAAFFDFDVDGDPDLLLVNSKRWPWSQAGYTPATSRLYDNDGSGRFRDVTAATGLDLSLYGMGAAVGDYDSDGDPDLYVAAVGGNRLLRNDRGRFTDVTALAGVGGSDQDWSTSAGFFDYDDDGDLDLFVCNYVRWSPEIDRAIGFTLNGIDRAYGPPKNFSGTFSVLYRNDGGGRFTDVSEAAGVQVRNRFSGEPAGKALALAVVDLDDDGRSDVFVANDTVQNFLFRNRGDGTFDEVGTAAGVAYDGMGNATGAMGVDLGDFRNDGTLGLAIGNFANETTSLYTRQGSALEFADMAGVEGLGSPSRLRLSFGVFFFDYDLDGRIDFLQANGHLEEDINDIQPSQHYRQPAQLFWNAGPEAAGSFVEVPPDETHDLSRPIVGRGATHADIDGDGDLDVLLTQVGGRPLLLRNDQALGHHWLRVRLRGVESNPDAVGARVEFAAAGETQRRVVTRTRSYLSQVEPTVTFGLGNADAVESVRVYWPAGGEQSVDVPGVDWTIQIMEDK